MIHAEKQTAHTKQASQASQAKRTCRPPQVLRVFELTPPPSTYVLPEAVQSFKVRMQVRTLRCAALPELLARSGPL